MEDVERLLKGTVEELDKLLDARNVLGDPIEHGGAVVIPMVSYGFGFGAGGGSSKGDPGAGTGGGGGIKPLGAVIIDDKGARVEAIQGAMRTMAEIVGETIAHTAEKPMKKAGASKAKE